MSTRKSDRPQLDRPYTPADMTLLQPYLYPGGRVQPALHTFGVPTRVYGHTPGLFLPRQARIYETSLYRYGTELWTRGEIRERFGEHADIGYNAAIFLCEVWVEEEGYRGDFQHVAWIFRQRADLNFADPDLYQMLSALYWDWQKTVASADLK